MSYFSNVVLLYLRNGYANDHEHKSKSFYRRYTRNGNGSDHEHKSKLFNPLLKQILCGIIYDGFFAIEMINPSNFLKESITSLPLYIACTNINCNILLDKCFH